MTAPQSVALPITVAIMKLVGRDSVEPEGGVDLIIQINVRYQRSLRSVIPNPECIRDEGPHNRGLTLKGPCVSVRMLARSLPPSHKATARQATCARDDSKKPNAQPPSRTALSGSLSSAANVHWPSQGSPTFLRSQRRLSLGTTLCAHLNIHQLVLS